MAKINQPISSNDFFSTTYGLTAFVVALMTSSYVVVCCAAHALAVAKLTKLWEYFFLNSNKGNNHVIVFFII